MRKIYNLLIIGFLIFGLPATSHSDSVVFHADPTVRVNVFPNPCVKILSLDVFFDKSAGPLEIRLRNVIGKEVIDMIADEKTGAFNHYEIDLGELPAGVYLLEISANSGSNPSKIIRRITKS